MHFCFFSSPKKFFIEDKELQNPVYALLAVLFGMTGAGSLSLLGSTTNDTYAAAMVLASLYFYLQSLDEKPARFYLSLSGLLMGAVFGLKLTNLSYLLALNVTLLFFRLTERIFSFYGCCCFLGFFIVDGAWIKSTENLVILFSLTIIIFLLPIFPAIHSICHRHSYRPPGKFYYSYHFT